MAIDATMIVDCSMLPDGTACDDRNICTSSSTCQAGTCTPAVPQASCMVADSEAEFDTTQGIDGWWYGFWDAETDPTYEGAVDFAEGVFDTDAYAPAQGTEPFLYLTWWGTHPSVPPRVLTVRRWISDVQGPAIATLTVSKADPTCGDGVQARLLVDDALAWQQTFAFDDGAGDVYPVPVELVPGTRVELLVEPLATDSCDSTDTALTISAP